MVLHFCSILVVGMVILPCVGGGFVEFEHTRRHIAAICRGDKSVLVYSFGCELCDTLQRQIASCMLENVCENLVDANKSLKFNVI